MVNIWDYYNADKVKITCTDGSVYTGDVYALFDVDETNDAEDSITLFIDDYYIAFYPSQIASIERL